MIHAPDRPVAVAAAIALTLHLLLFVVLRPSNGGMAPKVLEAPATRYLALAEGNARTVNSPVVFSLPSRMSFSRQHLEQKVQTPRFLMPATARDSFVEVNPSMQPDELVFDALMVTAADSDPGLPTEVNAAEKRPSARRVYLAPELKERLTGGVVLPPALNREVAAPWEVRASLGVSEHGGVSHVFLDQPLEPAALNQEVLKLLYGLRFKAGDAVEGTVEIYSPAPAGKEAKK